MLKIVLFLEDISSTYAHLCALYADVPNIVADKEGRHVLSDVIGMMEERLPRVANDETFALAV